MQNINDSTISFEGSNQFSKIILDYINNHPDLSEFYNLRPEVSSYQTMMEQKNYNDSFRPILVETLNGQYAEAGIKLNKSPKVESNINALLNPNTYTVTTGHQLCLYTGPLYFIYKILSTIKWCDELKQQFPDKNFVPVFWMATEDHDFEEVNHVVVNGTKYSWNIDSMQQPVGRLSLQNFDSFAQEIINLATNDFAKKQLKEWSACYTSSSNLSIATRKLAHLLFASKGLVVLDADAKPLKKLFIPIIKKDVLEQSNFNALTTTNNLLRKKYKTQVNGRGINFFYLSESGRKLIKKEGDVFVVDGTSITFTTEQITADIENNPEQYSPNVIMRPVYQELILPNLSYVGGPGEIAYWLQLKSVFEQNSITFPILTLRSFLLLLNEQHYNTLKRIGLSVDDLFAPSIDVERKLVALNDDGGQTEIIKNIADNLQAFIDIAMKTDNQIGSEIIHQKTTWIDLLEQHHRKLDKKQREKIALHFDKYQKIQSNYFFNGVMQERVSNITSYGITESMTNIIELVFEHITTKFEGINCFVKQG